MSAGASGKQVRVGLVGGGRRDRGQRDHRGDGGEGEQRVVAWSGPFDGCAPCPGGSLRAAQPDHRLVPVVRAGRRLLAGRRRRRQSTPAWRVRCLAGGTLSRPGDCAKSPEAPPWAERPLSSRRRLAQCSGPCYSSGWSSAGRGGAFRTNGGTGSCIQDQRRACGHLRGGAEHHRRRTGGPPGHHADVQRLDGDHRGHRRERDARPGRPGADVIVGLGGNDTSSTARGAPTPSAGATATTPSTGATAIDGVRRRQRRRRPQRWGRLRHPQGQRATTTSNGGAFADTLEGGDGDDHLTGGVGADDLKGGTGTDEIHYVSAPDSVTVNLDTGTASGGDGDDTFSSDAEHSGIQRALPTR